MTSRELPVLDWFDRLIRSQILSCSVLADYTGLT